MKPLVSFFRGVLWIAGVVIANGFWSTFFAIIFPLWALYLVAERVLVKTGIL